MTSSSYFYKEEKEQRKQFIYFVFLC